jgi:hypothetical protein
MFEVIVEWEHTQRRRASMEVPDGATNQEITDQADKMAHSGRAGQMDEILVDTVGTVHWAEPGGGRFGGRVR